MRRGSSGLLGSWGSLWRGLPAIFLMLNVVGCAQRELNRHAQRPNSPPPGNPIHQFESSPATARVIARPRPGTAAQPDPIDPARIARQTQPSVVAAASSRARLAPVESTTPRPDSVPDVVDVPEESADRGDLPVEVARDDIDSHIDHGSASAVVQASSEDAPATDEVAPSTPVPTVAPDRSRADRLMARARQNLDKGYRDEALRLAQIAERLELGQRVTYAPGEERPSQFLARLRQGESTESVADVEGPGTADHNPQPTASPRELSAVGTNEPAQRAADPAAADPGSVVVDLGPEVEIPSLSPEELEAMGAASKRFVRSAHRRTVRPQPVRTSIVQAAPVKEPVGEETPPAPLELRTDGEAGDAAGADVDTAGADLAPAPLGDELADLPVVTQSEPPPAPRLPRWWNWNRVSLAGLICGLTSLLLLWIWREVERWHYRLSRPA